MGAATLVPAPIIERNGQSEVGLIAFGSSHGATREAMDILERRGITVDYMRIRSFPFMKEVDAFLASHAKLFVIEQNRDAQMRSLLTLETAVEKAKLSSILQYSGLPISSSVIVDAVVAERGEGRKPTLAVVPGRK
jgi:2-oxoglutarate ferredoxin oxidoreductase subunit alpha